MRSLATHTNTHRQLGRHARPLAAALPHSLGVHLALPSPGTLFMTQSACEPCTRCSFSETPALTATASSFPCAFQLHLPFYRLWIVLGVTGRSQGTGLGVAQLSIPEHTGGGRGLPRVLHNLLPGWSAVPPSCTPANTGPGACVVGKDPLTQFH